MSISAKVRSWLLGETLVEAKRMSAEKTAALAEVRDQSKGLQEAADTNKAVADAAHAESRETVHAMRNFNQIYANQVRANRRTTQQAMELLSRRGTP